MLKNIIKNNLTETNLHINNKHIKIKAMTCFWCKENFSGIIQYYGRKYYCFFDRSINDIVVENC